MCPAPQRITSTRVIHARMAIGMSRRRAHFVVAGSERGTINERMGEDIEHFFLR
jgi:hypothetical protein